MSKAQYINVHYTEFMSIEVEWLTGSFARILNIGSGQIACACIYDSVSAEKWAGLGMEMSREEVIKLIRGFIDPTDIHKRGK